MFTNKLFSALALSLLLMTPKSFATDFEITPFIGHMASSDLSSNSGTDLSVDAAFNYGVGIAWQDTPNGQGQILINFANHDFASDVDGQQQSLDILYTHFNGVAQFRQHDYVTTMAIGLGGAYFKTDQNEELYASATIAVGTRYEFSQDLSLVTELRGYATLVDPDDGLFCEADSCHAQFEDSVFMEASVSIGITFKF